MISVAMNSEFLSFSSILIIFLLFYWMICTIRKNFKANNLLNLPPGPRKLPIIGNMHQFFGSLLHHKLRDMAKKYGPIMHLRFGEIPVVVISSAEAAKEIMKTHDILFAQRPPILVADIVFYRSSNIGFAPCGENWRRLKKICMSELLCAKRVQLFRSVREEEVSNLISSISSFAGSPVNLNRMLCSLSCSIISRATFGKKCKYQEAFLPIVKEVIDLLGGLSIPDLFPSIKFLPLITGYQSKLEKLHEELDMLLESIINEHRISRATHNEQGGAGNLVRALLNLQKNGTLEFPLSADNIKGAILDMFLGGIDTSATTMQWAMSEMIKNPRVMQKAQVEVRKVFNAKGNIDGTISNELKYLKLVIKETLRLHPPGPFLSPRESREHCKINGYDIPSRTRVLINAWGLGRDPNYWIEPDKFYPERFLESDVDFKGSNYEFLPFGSGRRICPGVSFAMSNVELTLACLLYYFDWEPCNGVKKEELDMMEALASVLRRKNDLYLIPIPFHKLPSF